MKLKLKKKDVDEIYGMALASRLDARRKMLALVSVSDSRPLLPPEEQELHQAMRRFNRLSRLTEYLWIELQGEEEDRARKQDS